MKLFFCFVLSVGFLKTSSQTLIVAVRQNEELYVGADSRVGSLGANSVNTFDTVTKIIPFGKYYLAFAGYINMSLPHLAKQIPISSSLYSTVSGFSILWKDYLRSEINKFRLEDRLPYVTNFSSVKNGEILFFGFENDKIVCYGLYATCVNAMNEPADIKITIDSLSKVDENRIYILMHGHSGAVSSLGRAYITEYGFIKGIQKLICKQSEATPTIVSAPIDIIHLKANKVEIYRFEKCD